MSIFQVFQSGNFNFARTSAPGGQITQTGDRRSLSLAFGFNSNIAAGSGRVFQQGTAGNDLFSVLPQTSQGGRFLFNGNGGNDVLNLPAGTIQFGNAFFNPVTRTGIFAQGIGRVNFIG